MDTVDKKNSALVVKTLISLFLLASSCGLTPPQSRIAACEPRASQAPLKIEGGTETSNYASVVLIVSGWGNDGTGDGYKCSGTIAGHNVVLTAAHCITSSPALTSVMQTASLRSTQEISRALQTANRPHTILTHGTVSGANKQLTLSMAADDLAILIFPDQTFSQSDVIISSLHKLDRPKRFSDTIMVGFGGSSQADKTSAQSAIKRVGRGFYFSEETKAKGVVFTHNRMLDPITLQPTGPKQYSQAHQGDSGGPLFYKRNNYLDLVGVASAVGGLADGQSTFTTYADLHSERSLSLLNQAITKGAVFKQPDKSTLDKSSESDAQASLPSGKCLN